MPAIIHYILSVLGTIIVPTLFVRLVLSIYQWRQLYLVIPELFPNTNLSPSGHIAVAQVINRGRYVEEDVQVVFDPELQYQLIASSNTQAKLEGNVLNVGRLASGEQQSLIIFVLGGAFDHDNVNSITSRKKTGKIFKRREQVPQNYGDMITALILALSLASAGIVGGIGYFAWQNHELHAKEAALTKLGWTGLDEYENSALKKSYHGQEFPLRVIEAKWKPPYAIIKISTSNKTSIPISIQAFTPGNPATANYYGQTYKSITIKPMSKMDFPIRIKYLALPKNGIVTLEFNFQWGSDFIYGIKKKIILSP